MLSDYQRAARYLAQTGRAMLTPRQRRRIKHKAGHQSVDATSARESQSADRQRAVGKRRSASPVQGATASVPDGAASGRVTGPNHNRKSLMKTIILAVSSVFALLLGGFTASTASAAAPVEGLKIGHINYDAAGSDSMTNRNQEFVDIVNDGTAAKNVEGLVFEDSYRHGNPTSRERACNKLVVKTLPDADGNRVTELPADHVLRIYVGSAPASPKAFTRFGKTIHPVYVDSPERCGYKGHFLNNNPPSSGRGWWDTVWITLGDQVESKSYQAYGGHYVR